MHIFWWEGNASAQNGSREKAEDHLGSVTISLMFGHKDQTLSSVWLTHTGPRWPLWLLNPHVFLHQPHFAARFTLVISVSPLFLHGSCTSGLPNYRCHPWTVFPVRTNSFTPVQCIKAERQLSPEALHSF